MWQLIKLPTMQCYSTKSTCTVICRIGPKVYKQQDQNHCTESCGGYVRTKIIKYKRTKTVGTPRFLCINIISLMCHVRLWIFDSLMLTIYQCVDNSDSNYFPAGIPWNSDAIILGLHQGLPPNEAGHRECRHYTTESWPLDPGEFDPGERFVLNETQQRYAGK